MITEDDDNFSGAIESELSIFSDFVYGLVPEEQRVGDHVKHTIGVGKYTIHYIRDYYYTCRKFTQNIMIEDIDKDTLINVFVVDHTHWESAFIEGDYLEDENRMVGDFFKDIAMRGKLMDGLLTKEHLIDAIRKHLVKIQ